MSGKGKSYGMTSGTLEAKSHQLRFEVDNAVQRRRFFPDSGIKLVVSPFADWTAKGSVMLP